LLHLLPASNQPWLPTPTGGRPDSYRILASHC
jgi:hypothetical protein